MKQSRVKRMVSVAMLSSIAYVLMMLDFPVWGLPAFLRIDFSEVPALLAAVVFGPAAGMVVEAIKNVLYYWIKGSFTGVPVGELANFTAGCLYILPTAYFFRKYRSTKGLTLGLLVGTVTMTLLMSVLNYYVIFPAYTWFLHADAMTAGQTKTIIVTGILPFNALKGAAVAIVFVLIFTRLKGWLQTRMA
ncbi:ECF transporter S component [Ectobacillus ponti]|uniref:Riboflavin transporter n=1 Tax=Ectobacillus ponti TaxID=2961894 RepID=A0AA41X9F0_9BACI|nr:ECF transporter S component [Ectobacillus ponti]MCP8968723.1 ECF transporter S component [Ectobacillus ponti]